MNDIVFGKSLAENIVCIEVHDEYAEVFFEKEGIISSTKKANSYWALTPYSCWGSNRLEGDLHYKYLNEFSTLKEFTSFKKKNYSKDFFTCWNLKEACLVKNGASYYQGMKVEDVSVLSFDIEATGLTHDKNSRVLIISNTFRKNGETVRKMFCYDDFSSDAEMFDAWSVWLQKCNPSIILGHNIFMYDLPYMEYCAKKAGTSLMLGRDGSDIKFDYRESKFRKDGSQFYEYKKAHIYGREIVDTFFLSIRYDIGRKYRSYGLKNIIQEEGLEIEGRQHYDAFTIKDNYTNPDEWDKIKKYAEHDADDALALYDLMIPPYFYMAQSIPKSFQEIICGAAGSQINSIMVRAYLQEGHSIPKKSEAERFEGAISMGNPGIYNNVLKVDVASLYPSIMIQYEVYDKDKDPKGYFKKMVSYFTEERLKNKELAKSGDRHFDELQAAQKILINSMYGFMGANGLPFNSPKNAAFITRKGREILTKGMDWVDQKGYTLVNVDTDSFSYTKNREVSKEEFDKDIEEINSMYPERIRWEDDGMYKKVIIVKAKNYILDNGSKVTYKGSSIKDQKKEPALREMMNKMFDALLSDESYKLEDIYHEYIYECQNIKDISRWCMKKTVTEAVFTSDRLNETKVKDAIEGENLQQGDKIYVYPAVSGYEEVEMKTKTKQVPIKILKLQKHWNGDEDKEHYLKRVYDTVKILENIVDMDMFPKYQLKSKKKELDKLLEMR